MHNSQSMFSTGSHVLKPDFYSSWMTFQAGDKYHCNSILTLWQWSTCEAEYSTAQRREWEEGEDGWVSIDEKSSRKCAKHHQQHLAHLRVLTSPDVDPDEARPSGAVLHVGAGVEGGSRL